MTGFLERLNPRHRDCSALLQDVGDDSPRIPACMISATQIKGAQVEIVGCNDFKNCADSVPVPQGIFMAARCDKSGRVHQVTSTPRTQREP